MENKGCLRCGAKELMVRGTARGPVEYYCDANGGSVEVETDKMWFDLSEVVRCGECLKIRRDLKYIKGKFVEVEQ